jgi:hypothetical protein
MIIIIKSLFHIKYNPIIFLIHPPIPLQRNGGNPMESTQEIRREKIYIPHNLTTKEIMEQYNILESSAFTTRKRG